VSRFFVVLVIVLLGAAAVLAPLGGGQTKQLVVAGLGVIALGLAAELLGRVIGRGVRRLFERRRPVIVVDGSNVMHWQDDVPRFEALDLVLSDLSARGFVPHVFFDANVGYKLAGRHVDPSALARALSIPRSQIFVAPSRTPADPLLIAHAIKTRARVVSNDRFRDWRDDFPALGDKGFLVPGRVLGERVELRLE